MANPVISLGIGAMPWLVVLVLAQTEKKAKILQKSVKWTGPVAVELVPEPVRRTRQNENRRPNVKSFGAVGI